MRHSSILLAPGSSVPQRGTSMGVGRRLRRGEHLEVEVEEVEVVKVAVEIEVELEEVRVEVGVVEKEEVKIVAAVEVAEARHL